MEANKFIFPIQLKVSELLARMEHLILQAIQHQQLKPKKKTQTNNLKSRTDVTD